MGTNWALRDDPQKRERFLLQVVEDNVPLAYKASTTFPEMLPRRAMAHEGVIGLRRAAERYDPERGTTFATYAWPWIRAAIQHAIEWQSRTIRVPSDRWRWHGRNCATDGPDTCEIFEDAVTYDDPGHAAAERRRDSQQMARRLMGLNPTTRHVVMRRYGLAGNEPERLEDIGRRFGFTKEWARKRALWGLETLRRSFD